MKAYLKQDFVNLDEIEDALRIKLSIYANLSSDITDDCVLFLQQNAFEIQDVLDQLFKQIKDFQNIDV
ncbi:MAG: hypothetical protein LBI78_07320 [Campylobacteraceae bacterium]|jgi:hypothetical protein|nr:hypothetical protein [Campylobacteraceae bacterium]